MSIGREEVANKALPRATTVTQDSIPYNHVTAFLNLVFEEQLILLALLNFKKMISLLRGHTLVR